MKKLAVLLIVVAFLFSFPTAAISGETTNENESLGEYCIRTLSLSFGAGWFINLHPDKPLYAKFKEIGIDNLTLCEISGQKSASCMFSFSKNTKETIYLYSGYFTYPNSQSKFPTTIKIGEADKTLTISGFCY